MYVIYRLRAANNFSFLKRQSPAKSLVRSDKAKLWSDSILDALRVSITTGQARDWQVDWSITIVYSLPRCYFVGPTIGHCRVPPGLCFKTRVGAQPLIWKSSFTLMQIKLIFTRKVVYLALFWTWGFLELVSGLFTYAHGRFYSSAKWSTGITFVWTSSPTTVKISSDMLFPALYRLQSMCALIG